MRKDRPRWGGGGTFRMGGGGLSPHEGLASRDADAGESQSSEPPGRSRHIQGLPRLRVMEVAFCSAPHTPLLGTRLGRGTGKAPEAVSA